MTALVIIFVCTLLCLSAGTRFKDAQFTRPIAKMSKSCWEVGKSHNVTRGSAMNQCDRGEGICGKKELKEQEERGRSKQGFVPSGRAGAKGPISLAARAHAGSL